MSTTTSSVFSATNRSIANPTVGATSASLFASFADAPSRSALTSVVLPELARPMMSRRRCGCVGSCVACVCPMKTSRVPFSRRIARSRARVATAGVAPPRPPDDAYLLLRQAERHQQALPQPHAFVGWDGAPRARRARVWAERVRPRCTRLARDVRLGSRFLARGAQLRVKQVCVAGKRRLSWRAFVSSRRRLRCLRVTPRRNGRRSQGRQTPQTRGAWFETPRRRGVPRRAARRSRDPASPTCPPIPPGGERASKALDRRLRRSPPTSPPRSRSRSLPLC